MWKIILGFFIAFIFLYNSVTIDARWYPATVSYSKWSAAPPQWTRTTCTTDWDAGDPRCVQINWSPAHGSTSSCVQDTVVNVPASWTMTCMHWDPIPPTWTIVYNNGWYNVNPSIRVNHNDTWGSWVSRMIIQRRVATITSSWLWSWSWWTQVHSTNISGSHTIWTDTNMTNHRAYQYRVQIEDRARNTSSWITSPNIYKFDNQGPSWIITYVPNWSWNEIVSWNIIWSNKPSNVITISWLNDSVWAWVRSFTVQKSTQNNYTWTWTSWTDVSWCVDRAPSVTTCTDNWPFTSHTAYRYRLVIQDNVISTPRNIWYADSPRVIRYDTTPPTWTITYFDGWTNQNTTQQISVNTLSDNIWVWVDKFSIQKRSSSSNYTFTDWWSDWSNLIWCQDISIVWSSWNCNPWVLSDSTAYQYRLKLWDKLWNESNWIETSSNITLKIDITSPDSTDFLVWDSDVVESRRNDWWAPTEVTSEPRHKSNLLAVNSQTFRITPSRWWWSPIVAIRGVFESNNHCWTHFLDFVRTWEFFEISPNINSARPWCDFDVDLWWREYSLFITYVKDEAWNETSFSWLNRPHFRYNVFSNHTLLSWTWPWIKSVVGQWITSNNNVADGTVIPLSVKLRDDFWNPILSWGALNRRLNFDFSNIENTMFLNQIDRSWGSSVFVDWLQVNNSFTRDNKIVANIDEWRYDFGFQAYTPTANVYSDWTLWSVSDPEARFVINDITLNINSTIWSNNNILVDNSSNIEAKFKPLFTTTISWDIVNSWIRDVAVQESNISTVTHWDNLPSDIWFLFWFWWTNSERYDFLYSKEGNPDKTTWYRISDISIPEQEIKTLLSLKPWRFAPVSYSFYFSTHLSYELDGNIIVYNSDVFGWEHFHDVENNPDNILWWVENVYVKVLWQVYSNDNTYSEIVEWQESSWDVIRLMWEITKSSLRSEIKRTAYDLISNVIPNNWNNIINTLNFNNNEDWVSILKGDAIYFWDLEWDNVIIDNNVTLSSWQKTIIIHWWNLYIRWNIITNWNWLLWIIVLTDNQWNWWNIYIDPDVTQIHSVMFADRSLLSYRYNSTLCNTYKNLCELDWNTSFETLRHQLYIRWSVFSQNTIWWSIKDPSVCPYYLTSWCDYITATKYDLNFLRKYHIIDDPDSPWVKNPAWLNTVSVFNYPHEYAKYPIVIEYNPRIQLTPPPWFSLSSIKN